ncbi:F-box/kelch-repeat protein [Prunus yedoensis var. nudiflora]|uniref:F-box/kelch-repeat protein n=1 Tax=Prunus yedoensis var. nudiflora TaxID=2094558 RepID=A0A314Y5K9_PRUYE|nr:F-box/kelch-repeat protein [Prunus yedoensis var. nudiflora]
MECLNLLHMDMDQHWISSTLNIQSTSTQQQEQQVTTISMETSLLDHQYLNNNKKEEEEDEQHHQRQLPCEIVEEILLQLPVKSLLRFRSVCKPWLALISDPKFIKSHLHNHSTKQDEGDDVDDGKTRSSKALVMLSSSLSLLKSVHVQVLDTRIEAGSAEADAAGAARTTSTGVVVVEEVHESPMRHQAVQDMKIVGSCNGLLCLVLHSQDMKIYNPSTRQLQPVPPPPPPPTNNYYSGKDYFYGFGYDSSNDDYKIVRASCSSRNGNFATHLDMYNLKTNSWRAAIKTLPCYFLSNVVGTLLNGALHWVVRLAAAERPFSIVSFDVTEETYRFVPLPGEGDKNFSFYGLGVLGGCLSMLHSPHGSDYEVWLMNEYGVKASWTIFTTIPQKMESEYLGLMSLVRILNNGEIVILLHQRKLVIYNPAHRTLRTILSGDIHSSQLALYLETLVSPSAAPTIKTYSSSITPLNQAKASP